MNEHLRAEAPTLVVIAGPTGVGKSALGLEAAARLGVEIVSADSRQVYRRLDIGTAKPTVADRERAPHHLVDYVEPDEPYSVARYRRDGNDVLEDLARRGVAGIVVGGTGHYVDALIDRIDPPRVAPCPELRRTLEQHAAERGPEALHDELRAVDPIAAAQIPATNVRRVVRALEVFQATGRPFSEVGRSRSPSLPALKLALTLPREVLYRRIDARVEGMLQAGWLEEVRRLLDVGLDPTLPALTSTGYRELIAHLRGDLSLAEATQQIKWATHAYVRRQYVWLRRRPEYQWVDADAEGLARAAERIEQYVVANRLSS